MKTELELLIDHLQSEVDNLKSAMEECVADWDYGGAELFKNALIYKQSKLIALRRLQNPNYDKISSLSRMIRRMEKPVTKDTSTFRNLNEKALENLIERHNQTRLKRIEESKAKLEELKAINPIQRIDDDTILQLLEVLETDEVNQLKLELLKNELYLGIRFVDETATMKLSGKMEDYLVQPTRIILKQMGFDLESYTKIINDFRKLDKLILLEEIAIITFEVFRIRYDQEITITVG